MSHTLPAPLASPLPFYLVNAFHPPQSKHGGSQAAVVVFPRSSDPRSKDERWMLDVAKDFGFSETAFLVPSDDASQTGSRSGVDIGKYGLRWFTPEVEVALCGHATLASASTLFSLDPQYQQLQFTTLSGPLVARRAPARARAHDGQPPGEIEISLPSLDSRILENLPADRAESYQGIAQGLVEASSSGLAVEDVINVVCFGFGTERSLMIELRAEVKLGSLKMDVKKLLDLCKGMIILTQHLPDKWTDILRINSRVFAPGLGIDEDPVTGSAHAYLTGYYLASPVSQRLPEQFRSKPKETVIDARQLSARGGAMKCTWDEGRAKLVGSAWEFARGTLAVEQD